MLCDAHVYIYLEENKKKEKSTVLKHTLREPVATEIQDATS